MSMVPTEHRMSWAISVTIRKDNGECFAGGSMRIRRSEPAHYETREISDSLRRLVTRHSRLLTLISFGGPFQSALDRLSAYFRREHPVLRQAGNHIQASIQNKKECTHPQHLPFALKSCTIGTTQRCCQALHKLFDVVIRIALAVLDPRESEDANNPVTTTTCRNRR